MPQRRKTTRPPLEIHKFSIAEIELGIKKLRRRVEEVKNLEKEAIRHDDPKKQLVQSNIHETILEIFGENSPEFQENQFYRIQHGSTSMKDTDYDDHRKFEAGIPHTITMLEGLISRLEEKKEDLSEEETDIAHKDPSLMSKRNIFIVHGHDELNTLRLEKLLNDRWKLNPIVLRDEPGKGRTLIEKFEQEAQKVVYAFVLLTPDDIVQVSEGKYSQARPNVIFELGWFYGKLGRDRVCILFKKGTKIHSDLDGISRIEFEEDLTEKVNDIAKELQEVNLI